MDALEVEWIVLLNGGAKWPDAPMDRRVVVIEDHDLPPRIGAIKRRAFEAATGEVLIELDHDDELLPGALGKIWDSLYRDARSNVSAFFYSSALELREDGSPVLYGQQWGWEHATCNGVGYNVAFPATPRSLCEIFFAPNHVRAWTRRAYVDAGGHDPALEVCDDHDLLIRTYLAGAQFIREPLPLYIQHFHGSNSQHGERNARIQRKQAELRDANLTALVHEWCRRNDYAMLDLGGAHGCPSGYTPVDLVACDGGIVWDVAERGLPPLDRPVGCVRAKDFLEHVPIGKVVPLMNHIHRRLMPGGFLFSLTPSTDGRGAFQDPTHVSFWNDNSWLYYTQAEQAKYVPAITARFQMVQGGTFPLNDWGREHQILYTQANLCALHGQRQPGAVGFPR